MENKIIVTESERLILRRYREEDIQDLFEYLSDPEVVKYEPYNKMIGNVYMGKRDFESLEIGYVFNRNYWGNGYAAESCKALIQQAFADGVHRIYAECDPDNKNSWKLLEALGFQREAHFRKNVYFWKDEAGNAIWKDTYVYAKLNSKAEED